MINVLPKKTEKDVSGGPGLKNLPADVGDRGSRNQKTWVQYLTLGAYYLSDLRNSVSSFIDLFLNFLFIHSNLIYYIQFQHF